MSPNNNYDDHVESITRVDTVLHQSPNWSFSKYKLILYGMAIMILFSCAQSHILLSVKIVKIVSRSEKISLIAHVSRFEFSPGIE